MAAGRIPKNARPRALLAAVAASFAAVLAGASVRADPRLCADPRVEIRGWPGPQWREAIARACATLANAPDSDRSARVTIAQVGEALELEATLVDGRSTVRTVRTPGSLEVALQALFELPPAPVVTAPAPPPEMAPAPEPAPTAPAPSPALHLGIDLGALAATRIAGPGPYYSIGLSAFAQFEVGAWGLGVDVRWEAIQWSAGTGQDLEMATLALGVTIARRFHARFADIDAGVSPRLVAETQSDTGSAGENTLATTDIRGAAFVRAALGHGGPFRPSIVLDAEVSPNRLRRSYRLDPGLPPLPAWSAGLGVGFAWAGP